MLGEDFMRCDICGKVFPLFNNDLTLEADKHGSGWHHVCKECLNSRNKQLLNWSTNTMTHSNRQFEGQVTKQ